MSLSGRPGYGEFSGDGSGLGNFNDFNDATDTIDSSTTVPLQPLMQQRSSMRQSSMDTSSIGRSPLLASSGNRMDIGGGGVADSFRQELMWLRQDNQEIRNAVILLETERDNLRHAIRKLKVENVRIKQKLKRIGDAVSAKSTANGIEMDTSGGGVGSGFEVEMDYDDIGRDFILSGGPHDPFGLRFEATIRDANGIEHKSAERFYWYKMAETFGDTDAMAKILEASTTMKSEEAMKSIKGFDENVWLTHKLLIWEQGQRLKLDQIRWIQNLLVYTDKTYIAVASQDKMLGTGWRKNRDEANKPILWDGENGGGKVLMRLRNEYKTTHAWAGPYEEKETEKKFIELKRSEWRHIDSPRRPMIVGGGRGRPQPYIARARGVGYGGYRAGSGYSRGGATGSLPFVLRHY